MKHVLAAIIAILAPIQSIIVVTVLLVVFDLISGILAARKRKEAITSASLRRTVSKMFIYLTAIIMGFLVETYLISGLLPVSKIVSTIIGLVELKSLLENLESLYGKSLFASLIAQLGSKNDNKDS